MGFDCNICIEPLSNPKKKGDERPIVTTKCGHLFHSECLKQWFEKSRTQVWTTKECPVCSQDLAPPTDLIRIYTTPSEDGGPSMEDYKMRIIKLEKDKGELARRLEIAFLQQREVEKKNTRLQKDIEKANKEIQGFSNLSREFQSEAAKWKIENEDLKTTLINLSKKVAEPSSNPFYPHHPSGFHPMQMGWHGPPPPPQHGNHHNFNFSQSPPNYPQNFAPRFSKPNPKYNNPPRFDKKKYEKNHNNSDNKPSQQNGNSTQSSAADVEDDEIIDKLVNEGSSWKNSKLKVEVEVISASMRDLKAESGRFEREMKARTGSPTDDVLNSMLNGGNVKKINGVGKPLDSPPTNQETSAKKEKTPPTNGEKPTPYQGNRQVFGKFYCSNCEAKWGSHRSFANKPQLCLYCKEEVFPYAQTPIIPKHELM